MNHLKNVLCAGGVIALAAAFTGCSESGTEPIFNPNAGISSNSNGYYYSSGSYSSSSINKNSLEYKELSYNYDLLDLYYIYGHRNDELEDFEVYVKSNNTDFNPKSYCIDRYAKVCNMYGDMSDPFTRYFDPSYAQYILSMLSETEALVGLGTDVIEVQVDGKTKVVINQVYENGPAEVYGLMEGDTVLTVNGINISSVKAFEAETKGEKGDRDTLEVLRGDETKTIIVKLDEYNAPTVYLTFNDSIPVIQITEFTPTTSSVDGSYGEFVKALNKIKDNYKAAIIDLRDNPGGDVDHCNKMSAELLSKGDTVIIDIETDVDSSGYGSNKTYFQKLDTIPYTAEKDGIGKDLYYVFLANENSASCAEVMLSAVTVNKKSPVVGQNSYGKGIGQYVIQTSYVANGLALITGLESMDKNGEIYHKYGIAPDYEIIDEDDQMEKALEIAKNAVNGKKEERTAGYGSKDTGHFAKAKAQASVGFPKTKKDLLNQMSGAYKIKKYD